MHDQILCCSRFPPPSWKWVAPQVKTPSNWKFFYSTPQNYFERNITRPNLAVTRAAWEAAEEAKSPHTRAVFSHDPGITARYSFLSRNRDIPHYAFAFNYSFTPSFWLRKLNSSLFDRVTEFVVSSTWEIDRYSAFFNIPPEKFRFIHWSIRAPEWDPDYTVPFSEPYVCAIGGNQRDYNTLLQTVEQLPSIPFCIVTRPHILPPKEVPPWKNLQVLYNLPLTHCMAILKRSQFMVLPMATAESTCGHCTLVSAMHLGKATVATQALGTQDYTDPGVTSLTVPHGNFRAMTEAVEALYKSSDLRLKLEKNSIKFVTDQCSEQRVVDYVQKIVDNL